MPRHLNSFTSFGSGGSGPSWWGLTATNFDDYYGNRPSMLKVGSMSTINGPSGTSNAVQIVPSGDLNNRIAGGLFRIEDFDEDWTLSFWFRMDSLGTDNAVFSRYSNASTDPKAIAVQVESDGALDVKLYDDAGTAYQCATNTASDITVSTWYMLSIVYTASSKEAKVYLDDSVNKTTTLTNAFAQNSLISHFAAQVANPSVAQYDAEMSAAFVYFNTIAEDSAQIDVLYNSGNGFVPSTGAGTYSWDSSIGDSTILHSTGVASAFHIDPTPGAGIFSDMLGNRTITENGTLSEWDTPPDGDTDGWVQSFNDVNYLSHDTINISADFTVSGWHKPAGANDTIFSNGTDATAGNLRLINLQGPNKIQIWWHNGTTGDSMSTNEISTPLANGVLFHFVLTYDKTAQVIRLYVDGVLAVSKSSVDNTANVAAGSFLWGRASTAGVHWSGGVLNQIYINEGYAAGTDDVAVLYSGGSGRTVYYDTLTP